MKNSAKPQQRSYRSGSSLYFSAGLLVSMILLVTAFEWKTYFVVSPEGPIDIVGIIENEEPEMKNVYIPSKPTPKIQSTKIEIVPELPPDLNPEPPLIDLTPDDTTPFNPLDILPGKLPGDKEETFMPEINQAAVPKAGYEAFYAYIFNRLRVPQHLVQRNMDGKVYVSFVIDTDGTLTDIQIVKGFDQQLEQQIIKILQEAPAWEPAWQHGRPVKTRMQIPIVVKINH